MALTTIMHRKRPAPSSSRAKKAGGGKKNHKQQRRYYKMPSEEIYLGFKVDHDIGDDMVEVNYKLEFDSIHRYEMLEDFVPSDSDHAVAVAKARDRHTGEIVSLKRVRPSEGVAGGETSLSAVARETTCLDNCVGHHNILQLKGMAMAADDETGDMFIVTEQLLGGSTLRSLLTRRSRFSEDETRAFMRQLLGAAKAMHGAGVTHRDINPDTIFVSDGGALKLCGFRCAITPGERFVDEETRGPPMGTLRYCSPEQLMGLRCYCPAEDIWAIGCVMAEHLAGEPLFTADTQDELLDETADLRDDIVNFGVLKAEHFEGVLQVALEMLSLAGRELLASLLAFDSEERPTAADALKHRWFAENDVVKTKSRVVRAYTQR